MKETKDEGINFLIRTIVGPKILSLNPVIMGGFVVEMYRLRKFYENKKLWENFESRFNLSPYSAYPKKFGDIDLYFLKSNSIYTPNHLFNWLVRDNFSYLHWETISTNKLEFNKVIRTPNTNTFTRHNQNIGVEIFQLSPHPHDSIINLMKTSDIVNCTIIWYKGDIFYHDDFLSTLEDSTLKLTEFGEERIKTHPLPLKIHVCNRILKYKYRYNLTIPSSLISLIKEVLGEYDNQEIKNPLVSGLKKNMELYP